MKKVFLLSTPLEDFFKLRDIADDDNSYSLGLSYLHSIIEDSGYLIDTKNYNTSQNDTAFLEIKNKIIEYRPDYLLLQMFTMNRKTSYAVLKIARDLNKDMKIIVGGIHATIMYEQLLRNFDIDYIVLGEGEETIIELLSALDSGADISAIKGIAYKRNEKVIKNPDRELIKDLDKLPFPKHSLFVTPKRTIACILTSRGCPFKCNFCCLHTISKQIYRKRSVANIISEIEELMKDFPNINTIQIADDTFTLDQNRVVEFCKEIVKRNIKLNFYCSARIKPTSREMFEWMEKAGFNYIGFGLETGCQKLMDSIHKNITKEDVRETFRALKTIKKINVTTFMMLGFPGETDLPPKKWTL
jgi:radical SAM superfamily enzyme YgiQ (UPF0313 family)